MSDSLITELDIDRMARYLASKHRDQALSLAKKQAEVQAGEGKDDMADIWSRVAAALD